MLKVETYYHQTLTLIIIKSYNYYPSNKSTPISLIDRMMMIIYNKINYIQKSNLGQFNPNYDIIKYYKIQQKNQTKKITLQ